MLIDVKDKFLRKSFYVHKNCKSLKSSLYKVGSDQLYTVPKHTHFLHVVFHKTGYFKVKIVSLLHIILNNIHFPFHKRK